MNGSPPSSNQPIPGEIPGHFAADRYSEQPFPPYRFVPGRHPHPTAHVDGHSYHEPGTPEPEVLVVTPDDWRRSPEFLYGCDLYNHAYWWEAHEAWEGLWQEVDKKATQGFFLQGLIQTSACHLKWFVGHDDGVRRLLASSMSYLQQVVACAAGKRYMGLDVADFLARVRAYYAVRLDRPGSRRPHDPESYPYVRPA